MSCVSIYNMCQCVCVCVGSCRGAVRLPPPPQWREKPVFTVCNETCFSPYSLISLGRWEGTCFWAEVFWTEISQGKACKCKACCFRLLRCHTVKVCSFYGCFLCGWQYFTRANGVFCRLSGGAGWYVLAVLAFWKTVFRRVKGCVSGCNRTLLTALNVFRRMFENVVLQFSRT